MKIVDGSDKPSVPEGEEDAIIQSVVRRPTRKGPMTFWKCQLPDGRSIEVILPITVKAGGSWHRFIVAALGTVEVGQEIEPEKLVGTQVVVTVRHIKKNGRVYANGVRVRTREQAKQEEAQE